MKKHNYFLLTTAIILFTARNVAQSIPDTLVLRDIAWDKILSCKDDRLAIPSDNSIVQGFIYKANGGQKHPTLLLLHGYPGNERNLDLAQVVRAHG